MSRACWEYWHVKLEGSIFLTSKQLLPSAFAAYSDITQRALDVDPMLC